LNKRFETMKRLCIMLFVGSFALAACNRETKTTETTETTTMTGENAAAGEADYQAEYRDRANRMASQMSTDMQLDTTAQSQVEDVYYDRSRRVAEIHNRYNFKGNNQSGGLAADTTGMYGEIHAIDVETDNKLRDILSPIQYKTYETKRSTYFSDGIEREVKVDGDEITVKTGDIKVKAEPGESKVETSKYESKIDGDERKYKSKDTKIKSEPGESKYKSGDTKIKKEEQD
jgi:hypothetical protein